MKNIYRNVFCGDLRISDVGKDVQVAGWVNSIRNLGGLAFLTLRDETGIVQIISEDLSKIEGLTRESTVTITGKVRKRTDVNPKMKTGDIEILLDTITVLGKSLNVLPSHVST